MSSSTTQSPAETSPQAEAAEASGGAMTPITNSPKRAMTRSYRKEKNLESPNLSLSMVEAETKKDKKRTPRSSKPNGAVASTSKQPKKDKKRKAADPQVQYIVIETEKKKECGICYEPFDENRRMIAAGRCGHIYCENCICMIGNHLNTESRVCSYCRALIVLNECLEVRFAT